MSLQIEMAIEKMNHGNWLKVTIPYITPAAMTATLQNQKGELLRMVRLVTGNNLIDLESIPHRSLRIKIDTPFETLLKEFHLD
jgi:hypothetical protein